jgi:hypothetical protein
VVPARAPEKRAEVKEVFVEVDIFGDLARRGGGGTRD